MDRIKVSGSHVRGNITGSPGPAAGLKRPISNTSDPIPLICRTTASLVLSITVPPVGRARGGTKTGQVLCGVVWSLTIIGAIQDVFQAMDRDCSGSRAGRTHRGRVSAIADHATSRVAR